MWKSAHVFCPFFYCSVFAFLTDLVEFWYVLVLAATSETLLNKSSGGRHSCLTSGFKRNADAFTFRINRFFKSSLTIFVFQLENLIQLHLSWAFCTYFNHLSFYLAHFSFFIFFRSWFLYLLSYNSITFTYAHNP